MLAHYLAELHGLGGAVTPEGVFSMIPDHSSETRRGYPAYRFGGIRGLPLIAVCHQPYALDRHRGFPVVFLIRNAYDVVVSSYYDLSSDRRTSAHTLQEFIQHPVQGLAGWISHLNSWAPRMITHRDAMFVSYRMLNTNPEQSLSSVLGFVDVPRSEAAIGVAASQGTELRSSRRIRTGQEGNFWDHLSPEEIFSIQETLHRELSDVAIELLRLTGVEIDPFPRTDPDAT